MRVVALISGGKDSCYSMMKCVAVGHQIVALANLQPADQDELDSYMFQTVGHEGIHLYAEAMGLPLYQETTNGVAITKEMNYDVRVGDEVEDMYRLLSRVLEEVEGGVEGVSSGAILSDYQRLRVENVCARLGLVSLAYLWRRDQEELLKEMAEAGVEAVLIKVAAMGLSPDRHLGKNIKELHPELCSLNQRYGINVCGEGGEYETFTLDCPLFKKSIVIEKSEVVVHSNDAFAPVAFLKLTELRLQDKEDGLGTQASESHTTCKLTQPTPVPSSSEVLLQPVCTNNPNMICVTRNSCTWLVWDGDPLKVIVQNQTRDLFSKIGSKLCSLGCGWVDVVFTYLFLADMAGYKDINTIYSSFFSVNPPARVCVGVVLPEGVQLRVAMVVVSPDNKENGGDEGLAKKRSSMHVQSLSEWAPANIGPYSQAYTVGQVILVAGQIGLHPANMGLVSGSLAQATLALGHVGSILKACRTSLSDALHGTCYYTTEEGGWSARQAFAMHQSEDFGEKKIRCPILFVRVWSLPRAASVEWHFMALRSPYSATYWTNTVHIEGAGLLSLQEAWSEQLHAGTWLAETSLPYSSSHVELSSQLHACLHQLNILLCKHSITLCDVTAIILYAPRLALGQTISYSELQDYAGSFLSDLAGIAAPLILLFTEECWLITGRVSVLILKLPFS